jgi:hypothetical protein
MENAMQKGLETEVARTATDVEKWRGVITGIDRQFEIANLALANAKKSRETHALKASMLDAAAIAVVQHARAAQREAEQTIEDLTSIALPAARLEFAAAEKAAASARHALAKLAAEALKRKRIAVAHELDAVIGELASVYREFESIGHSILNMPDALPPNINGTLDLEGVVAARRVRAALPAFVQTLYPGANHDEQKKEDLATSEARFWNLPEQPEKKAA